MKANAGVFCVLGIPVCMIMWGITGSLFFPYTALALTAGFACVAGLSLWQSFRKEYTFLRCFLYSVALVPSLLVWALGANWFVICIVLVPTCMAIDKIAPK